MRVRVLGPLEVSFDAVLALGAPKQQVVLAMLAVNSGRTVGVDELVDELWPDSPPASAVENVRSYAASLRRIFRSADGLSDRIARRGSGYLLTAEPDELDLLTFADNARRAREAAALGDPKAAMTLFGAARALWRGPMLAGLGCGPVLTARCAAVEEERLTLVENEAEARLACAEPALAVALLRELVAVNPLREHAHALLMHALYQVGDIGGALAGFAAARDALVDQLGLEPGSELLRLHTQVLNRDPDLEVGPASQHVLRVDLDAIAPPQELPPDIGCFVGRTAIIGTLCDALTSGDRAARRRPVVVALHGRGGVGKSALAVRVAHEIAEHYPDGQIYVDLFGSTPGLRPLDPMETLGHLLRSLGIRPEAIPADEATAVARFRSLCADRRILLVLDNAHHASQVSPLLPASGGCAVVVTSRQPLGTVDADRRLCVDVLPRPDGVALIRALTGITQDEAAAGRLVDLCEGLPLAIRIAAGRLLGRPDLSIVDLAERLADGRRRLDELEMDGLSVRSCIRLGYEGLAAGSHPTGALAARAFDAIGLLEVPDVQADIIAGMLNEPEVAEVATALDHLVSAQLLEVSAPGRYRAHDLVRLVAAEVAATNGSEAARVGALHRAFAYYLGNLAQAEDILRPGRMVHLGDPLVATSMAGSGLKSLVDASRWVSAEMPNLLAAVTQASRLAGAGPRYALWISYCMSLRLYYRLQAGTMRVLGRRILETAERVRDIEMEGWACLMLGRAEAELGQNDDAMRWVTRALPAFADRHQYGTALTLLAIGTVNHRSGRQSEALAIITECLDLAHERGFASVQAVAHFNMGNANAAMGDWTTARKHLDISLELRRETGDVNGIGTSLGILAVAACKAGDLSEARRFLDEAMLRASETDDRLREGHCLLVDSEIHLRLGKLDRAAAVADHAVLLARRYGHEYAEAAGVRQQAKSLAATGDHVQAAVRFADATDLFAALVKPPDVVIEALLTETLPKHPAE